MGREPQDGSFLQPDRGVMIIPEHDLLEWFFQLQWLIRGCQAAVPGSVGGCFDRNGRDHPSAVSW